MVFPAPFGPRRADPAASRPPGQGLPGRRRDRNCLDNPMASMIAGDGCAPRGTRGSSARPPAVTIDSGSSRRPGPGRWRRPRGGTPSEFGPRFHREQRGVPPRGVARVPDPGRVPPAHAARRASAGRRRDGEGLRVDGGRHGWAADRQGQSRAGSLRIRRRVRGRAETVGRASVPVGWKHKIHPAGSRQQAQRDGHGEDHSACRRHREPGGTRQDPDRPRRSAHQDRHHGERGQDTDRHADPSSARGRRPHGPGVRRPLAPPRTIRHPPDIDAGIPASPGTRAQRR